MTNLYKQLQIAKSEEDVKDAYIKALNLKKFNKGLVDIQTNEIWFEAKEARTPPVAMFAQLLFYVREAKIKGEHIPPFLSVIDREQAAIMKTEIILPLLNDKNIKWAKSASAVTPENIKQVQPYIEKHFILYEISTHENEFIEAVKNAIEAGDFIRTHITPDNLRIVFDKWVEMIGVEIEGVSETDYALLFFADIMFDDDHRKTSITNLPARLLFDGEKPVFQLEGKIYELATLSGYRRFWQIYHRPPNEEYREYLLERRDSLLPIDERSFKGAYYTPLKVVEKAYDLLTETLGKNWQQKYIVWDMCCGVGNLEVKHSNYRNVYMSTLDKADIDVMKASRTCIGATQFQYDYLNDDINDKGEIDYTLTNKVPKELQQAIADAKAKKKGAKKILVLMNPPYAEATNANNTSIGAGAKNKDGVAKTKFAKTAMEKYGKASNELFTQFVARISYEIPNATLAMFSTLKYVNAPNFEKFRNEWKAKYLSGFVVHSKAFDGLNGNFPIGFLVWDTSKKELISEVQTKVLDKNSQFVGIKDFYNLPKSTYLNVWIKRPRANSTNVIPLKNCVSIYTSVPRVKSWSDNAIAYMWCLSNDIQNVGQQTAILSSVRGGGNGFYITPENIWQASIVFTVRQVVKHTWLNHNDQFLQPTENLTDEFKHDCLIYMLFAGKNITASADNLEWNNKKWSIVNHFIPFTGREVNSTDRFESDFMVEYLKGKKLSLEASEVLQQGKVLWQAYFASEFEKKIRDEYKLNRPDVGWYQIRKALEANNKNGYGQTDFSQFKNAYEVLSEKLRPMVYALGFLR